LNSGVELEEEKRRGGEKGKGRKGVEVKRREGEKERG